MFAVLSSPGYFGSVGVLALQVHLVVVTAVSVSEADKLCG